MAKRMTLGELYAALEDYIDEYGSEVEDLPALIMEKSDLSDGYLTDVDIDGENLVLTYVEAL